MIHGRNYTFNDKLEKVEKRAPFDGYWYIIVIARE